MRLSTKAIEEAIGIAETEGQMQCVVAATAELAALVGATPAWALQEAAAHLDAVMIILTSELSTLSPKLRLMYDLLDRIQDELTEEAKEAANREAAAYHAESEA